MAEGRPRNNLTSTPRKSHTLPPNTHLSPVQESTSGSNGRFLNKIKKIFRINSKGKYDLAPSSLKIKPKRKEYDEMDFYEHNTAVRSSSVRVTRSSKFDKEEVILLAKGQVVLKNGDRRYPSPSCVNDSNKPEQLDDLFDEPGYESLDEIRQKVLTHSKELKTKGIVQRSQSEKLPPASTSKSFTDNSSKSMLCPKNGVDVTGNRDSGIESAIVEERDSTSQACSATSSVFSEAALADNGVDLRETNSSKKSISRPNSCPSSKPVLVEIQNTDNVHHSEMVLSNSDQIIEEDSLYANSSILLRKRSQYNSDKPAKRGVSENLSSTSQSPGNRSQQFSAWTQKCVSENNLTSGKLSLTSVPPPLPQRHYSKAEVDTGSFNNVSETHSGVSLSERKSENETYIFQNPVANFSNTIDIENDSSIYEDIDKARENARSLAKCEKNQSRETINHSNVIQIEQGPIVSKNDGTCPVRSTVVTPQSQVCDFHPSKVSDSEPSAQNFDILKNTLHGASSEVMPDSRTCRSKTRNGNRNISRLRCSDDMQATILSINISENDQPSTSSDLPFAMNPANHCSVNQNDTVNNLPDNPEWTSDDEPLLDDSELPSPELPSPSSPVRRARETIHVSWAELHHQNNESSRDEYEDIDEDDNPEMTDSRELKQRDFLENMRQLRDCGWYWGPLSYEEAEAKLINKPDGSFLVRDSSNENYILSLSFISNNEVRHTRIEHNKGLFSFWSQPESHGKVTIKEFIEQTVTNSKNGNFQYFLRAPGPGMPPMPIQLLYPVSRFVKFRSLQHMCRFLILRWVRRDHIDRLPVPEKVKNYLRENQYYVETLEED